MLPAAGSRYGSQVHIVVVAPANELLDSMEMVAILTLSHTDSRTPSIRAVEVVLVRGTDGLWRYQYQLGLHEKLSHVKVRLQIDAEIVQ